MNKCKVCEQPSPMYLTCWSCWGKTHGMSKEIIDTWREKDEKLPSLQAKD